MKGKLITLLIVTLLAISGCSNDTSKTEQKKETEQASASSEPKFAKLIIEKVNESQFYVVTTADGNQLNYAYYVYKNGEVLDKFQYKKDAHFSYTVKEPGTYKVEVYIKDRDGNI